MLTTLRKVEDHENHVRWIYLKTVLNMGESQKYVRIGINHLMYLMTRWVTNFTSQGFEKPPIFINVGLDSQLCNYRI